LIFYDWGSHQKEKKQKRNWLTIKDQIELERKIFDQNTQRWQQSRQETNCCFLEGVFLSLFFIIFWVNFLFFFISNALISIKTTSWKNLQNNNIRLFLVFFAVSFYFFLFSTIIFGKNFVTKWRVYFLHSIEFCSTRTHWNDLINKTI
jgi:hypothetical protein